MLLSSHKLINVLEIIGLLALLVAVFKPGWGAIFFTRIERDFRELARQRYKAILIAALFPMLVRLLMLPWYPPPAPQIHDEFSYLLQGDTFAHGRLANPTPPYWQHFESEYILLQPSYASQYQPAQGLVLAFGEVVLRNAWLGVWLSVGLMCASICWALGYVLPPAWALFGAFAAALQFGIFGIWMNSYFGGAASAIAGALILGSLVRMKTPRKARSSAALCAFGIIVLFASRPVEALVWSGVALCWVLFSVRRKPGSASWTAILTPFILVFLVGSAALAYYNWRITGDPVSPPYLEYRRIYGTPQPYWWQGPVNIASFNFPELKNNYLNQLHLYEARYSPGALIDAERIRLRDFWRFFVGPFFTPALLFMAFIFRDRRIRPWLYASIPFILDKATYHAWYPSHNGPATILIVLVIVQCWRHMAVWRRTRRTGLAISRQMIAACCLTIVLGNLGRAMEPILPKSSHLPRVWESMYPARRLRDEVLTGLEKAPGKHLVFVKYSADHCFCDEWVFNMADIRSQRVVFARMYTPESDQALARYLGDRDVWIIEPDAQPYRLARIESSNAAGILSDMNKRKYAGD